MNEEIIMNESLILSGMNRYFAEKCNIPENTYWDIADPRCREIVRDIFFISTEMVEGNWYASNTDSACVILQQGSGNTIKEAELACLQAIYEARNV